MKNRRDKIGRKFLTGAIEKEIEPVIMHMDDKEKDKIVENYFMNIIERDRRIKENEVKHENFHRT